MRTCELCKEKIYWWQRKRLPFHKACDLEVKVLLRIVEIVAKHSPRTTLKPEGLKH